jgi:hypothetical protein
VKNALKSCARIVFVFIVPNWVFLLQSAALAEDALNRSIYIPIEIELCEHLQHGVLYRGNEAIRPLPGRQTFQFTYYPSLHRIVPETEHLAVKAVDGDGEPLEVELVVTSSAVYVGSQCVHMKLQKQMNRLRTRVDVRYDTVKLKIVCSKHCSRPEPKRIADHSDP